MSELNKTLVRRAFEEVVNRGQLQVIAELTAPNYVQHDPNRPEDVHGPAGLKQSVEEIRTAFPDVHISIDEMLAEGDKVVVRWTATGTQRGVFSGIPATGKAGNISGITIFRFENGKIAEEWQIGDRLGLLQQLGVIPNMAPAGAR